MALTIRQIEAIPLTMLFRPDLAPHLVRSGLLNFKNQMTLYRVELEGGVIGYGDGMGASKDASQFVGADAVDGLPIPNEPGKGYFDLDEALKIKKEIHSWGMEINRVSLPYMSENYMDDGDGAEAELEDCCQSLRVIGASGNTLKG